MFRFDKFNNFERWGRSLMALAIVLLSLIVVASPASAAQTCNQPGSSHCYMLSTLGPVVSPYAFTGFEDEIYPHCLSVTNPSSD